MRRAAAVSIACVVWIAGCVSAPTPAALTGVVRTLNEESRALGPLVRSASAAEFLAATRELPSRQARTIFQEPGSRTFYSQITAVALAADTRASLKPVELDETRYYYTRYGSPLAYVRAVDLLASFGVESLRGKRVLDFGYGTVGHLRLMATLGAHAVGVDVDSYLHALYSEPDDAGTVHGGSVRLLHGRYPAEAEVTAQVGGGYDVIVSKNTLKRGYINPVRPADKRLLIDLGVSNEVFLGTLFDALKPGGLLLVYNLSGAQASADKPYIPAADGHSPFTPPQFETAGFRVLAHDVNDDSFARAMGLALGWDRNNKGEVSPDFDRSLFALYTVAQRPR